MLKDITIGQYIDTGSFLHKMDSRIKIIFCGIIFEIFIEILKNTSLDLGVRGYDNYYGYGLLDLESIVKNYLKLPPLIIEGARPGWLFDSESKAYYFINNNGQTHTG